MGKAYEDPWTDLDQFFQEIGAKGFGRVKQKELCEGFLARPTSFRPSKSLSEMFASSLRENSGRDLIEQPFVKQSTLKKRVEPKVDSRGTNKVSFLLKRRQRHNGFVPVKDGPEGYGFKWVNREIPPFRQERAGRKFSGAGGIDYTGVTVGGRQRLVLGEVKCVSKSSLDKNAFYAFVQLLWYLSRMATGNQIERARQFPSAECGGFGIEPKWPQRFDLQIVLVDLHLLPASTQRDHQDLVGLTRDLAVKFRNDLPDEASQVLGRILCLQMDKASFAESDGTLQCLWCVP